jgi:hypothetical protein
MIVGCCCCQSLYRSVRCLVGLITVLVRRDLSKDAELLVLRHEDTVLRRQIARVPYTPPDRVWLAALSRLLPRCRWSEVFPVTPATILVWHRRLVSRRSRLPSTIRAPQEPELGEAIAKVHRQVAELLCDPPAIGFCGGAQQVHGSVAELHYEEDVDPLEHHHAVQVEEVAATRRHRVNK